MPGWTGLRSLPFDCTPAHLAALPGAVQPQPGIVLTGDLCLVLQQKPGRLMVHALTKGGDPVAQSRWLKALRLSLEVSQ